MPLYDYRCPQGHLFEQLAIIAAGAEQDCPVCGQASAKMPSRITLGDQAQAHPASALAPASA
jgi:putative FmdB family regulatory protein